MQPIRRANELYADACERKRQTEAEKSRARVVAENVSLVSHSQLI